MLGTLAGTTRTYRTFESDAEGGWIEKASIMRALAQADVTDLEMQEHWRDAMRQGKARERVPEDEIRAWFDYLRRNLRYTPASIGNAGFDSEGRPIPRTQVLLRPAVAFRRGLADCTAFATAGAAGLAIAGYDSDFVFISTRRDGIPSHVYLRVWYPARSHRSLVAWDASAPYGLGWEVPRNRVSWSRIVPVFAPWTGTRPQTSGVLQLSGIGCHGRPYAR